MFVNAILLCIQRKVTVCLYLLNEMVNFLYVELPPTENMNGNIFPRLTILFINNSLELPVGKYFNLIFSVGGNFYCL